MARLVQEKIKQPLAEELLFGKLVDGGEVKVRIKDNAPGVRDHPGAAQGRQGQGQGSRQGARAKRRKARREGGGAPEAEKLSGAFRSACNRLRRRRLPDMRRLPSAREFAACVKHRPLAACALAAGRRPFAAHRPPRFDPQRLSQHVQTLGSDAFEGPRPGDTRARPRPSLI